jgi:glutamate racemase
MPGAPTIEERRRPVGVFDSGVGGLTVLHELLVALPHEDFLYLGDTARFPYGPRSTAELQGVAAHCASELVARDAKLLVVACNTATAAALPSLQARFGDDVDVIGVIGPESNQAAVLTRNGRVGVLATEGTVASGAYERALHQADPHLRVTSVACPELAPLIQSGATFEPHVVDTVREYCAPLRAAGVDTVILGCTHYPLLRPMLQRMLGRDVAIVTAGAAIARRVESALAARDLGARTDREGDYRFLCTGDPDAFRAHGTQFLQLPLGPVEHVDVAAAETVVMELPPRRAAA